MLALLSEQVVWWHWVALGLVLLIVEMNTGTFLFLGIGLAAALVGAADYFFDTSFAAELLGWALLSIAVFAAWVRWFKEPKIATTGQSNHGLDIRGTVTEAIAPPQRGTVVFDAPVLGNATWHATAKTPLPKGVRIQIAEINGQLMEVEPI